MEGNGLLAEYTAGRVHSWQSTQLAEYTAGRVHSWQSTQLTEYTADRVHSCQSTQLAEYTAIAGFSRWLPRWPPKICIISLL